MADDDGIIHSQYDFWPDPGKNGSDTPDLDRGKDLSYLVPLVDVAWDTPPSYNLHPPNPGVDGASAVDTEDIPSTPPIRADLPGMRAAEAAVLSSARTAVEQYQRLRDHVFSVKDTVFGQKETDLEKDPSYYATAVQETPSDIQPIAHQFAASMNPTMEKALHFFATTLELVGEYVALINTSGQTYARMDRHSRFSTDHTGKVVVGNGARTSDSPFDNIRYGFAVPPRENNTQ
ncbi:hypothetical protein [Streptomyces sp. B3I8]|uniref:hypothetical protein n=1 Tax=Streptomyces sp. B3I8 TaxID=3042303 RepID=UPI00277DA3AB|nr:hypothetical protein [Streptomyces sp. B3I8]MDQ0786692.1 hypothetical protein [Streptomyces sp. B3I8]